MSPKALAMPWRVPAHEAGGGVAGVLDLVGVLLSGSSATRGCWVKDRSRFRGAPGRRLPIKLVVEDGFDGAVGPCTDLDGAFGGGFEPRGPERSGEADDAQAGAVALLGMGPAFEDLLAQRRRSGADLAGVLADALDGPAGVAPVAGGHVLGKGGVLPVPARPYMDGDALAFVEDLDAAGRHPRLDIGASETVGDGVIMGVDFDVIVDADIA